MPTPLWCVLKQTQQEMSLNVMVCTGNKEYLYILELFELRWPISLDYGLDEWFSWINHYTITHSVLIFMGMCNNG